MDICILIFPAILIPASASSSATFRIMYSAYKLNNQGDNILLDILLCRFGNQSAVPHPILIVAS